MKATLWRAWAGQALLPLAPLATVAALILALRVVAPSLRWVHFQGDGAEDSAEGKAAQRPNLIEDRSRSCQRPSSPSSPCMPRGLPPAGHRQFLQQRPPPTPSSSARTSGRAAASCRSIGWPSRGVVVLGTVAVALGLRWLIDRFELPKKHLGWGWLAAYVEVAWVALFARRR